MKTQRCVYQGGDIPQTVHFTAVPQARYLPSQMMEAILAPIAEGPEKYESATVIACSSIAHALDRYPVALEQVACIRDDEGHWEPV